jgi:hypothetical protein
MCICQICLFWCGSEERGLSGSEPYCDAVVLGSKIPLFPSPWQALVSLQVDCHVRMAQYRVLASEWWYRYKKMHKTLKIYMKNIFGRLIDLRYLVGSCLGGFVVC